VCLWLTIFIASLCASWQGIGAGYAISANHPEASVARVAVAAQVPENGVVETGSPGTTPLSFDTPPAPPLSNATPEKTRAPLPTFQVEDIPPVTVAVLDTGIDAGHVELSGRVTAAINLTGGPTADDVYGHGTPIAGIIAAADDGQGVSGLAPQSCLINVKVADDKGKCQLKALAEGIVWAVDHGARVINISIEFKESSPKLQEAVDYAWENGAIIIAAAGNDAGSQPVYPAAYENCIAVTAISEDGTLAPLANYGDWVDVAAPGFNIYAILPDNGYGYKYGTSFATAYVSGLAALLFPLVNDDSGDGNLNDEVRRAIESGCDVLDIAGTGWGSINIARSTAVPEADAASLP
jgi:thermitase